MATSNELFRVENLVSVRDSGLHMDAMAERTYEGKQVLAMSLSRTMAEGHSLSVDNSDRMDNLLLVRSIEEDNTPRIWRFPVRTTKKQQKNGWAERIQALEFSPEGDWLAALSSRKNRLHLIPVTELIGRQRRRLLHADACRNASSASTMSSELLNVEPSVMTTQMAAYLRPSNEAGGVNGARYQSQVAGDKEQMSTLEFSIGLGRVTCCCWWRSLNGIDYCLIGGSECLVSFVNVKENTEECRCELQNAGEVLTIQLLSEKFRRESRTTMLVKTRDEHQAIRYYRVVLEKKQVVEPPSSTSMQASPQQSRKSMLSHASPRRSLDDTYVSTSPSVASPSNFERRASRMPPLSHQKPQYVIKTFPEHFLQDLDFRPQRILKQSPSVRLLAVNSMLSSESSLTSYDQTTRTVRVYSNFQWSLKREYQVPSLSTSADEQVTDVDLAYTSSDLILLRGQCSESGTNVSTWLSLPSRKAADDEDDTARIVHHLRLRDDEEVQHVIQTTKKVTQQKDHAPEEGEEEVVYLVQTKHNVYECRPQWSRLALFKALCNQTLSLDNALSIGYALGTDMASLCQVVAETLCSRLLSSPSTNSESMLKWIRDLFQSSRAFPSAAIEQLTAIDGSRFAIEYARSVVESPSLSFDFGSLERQRVSFLLIELVLNEQLRRDSVRAAPFVPPSKQLGEDDVGFLEQPDVWLDRFLQENDDYATEGVVDLLLSHHQLARAISVSSRRDQVHNVLQKIIDRGLAAFASEDAIDILLQDGKSELLTLPESRTLLRSLSIDTQIRIMLAYTPSILQQRDWILRHLDAISDDHCRALLPTLHPTDASAEKPKLPTYDARHKYPDTSTSVYMEPRPEEVCELYLSVLLRLVYLQASDKSEAQKEVEDALKQFTGKYRPPVMIARCVDYKNWTAAAYIYQVHQEPVHAIESRLHGLDPSAGSQNAEEILALVQQHVLGLDENSEKTELVGRAILSRILVKWFELELPASDLETFVTESNERYEQLAPLFGSIFFATSVDAAVSTRSFGHKKPNASEEHAASDQDQEWIRKCHKLPFSGSFLFKILSSFLQSKQTHAIDTSMMHYEEDGELLELVKENIEKNEAMAKVIHVAPHSATALGKSDPLETHAKVFTCGHVFPKRVFEEEVLPEFDRRMNSLPVALFTTKQLLLNEFKRSIVQAPCAICCFNHISRTIEDEFELNGLEEADLNESRSQSRRSSLRLKKDASDSFYFLHRQSLHHAYSLSDIKASSGQEVDRAGENLWQWKAPSLS